MKALCGSTDVALIISKAWYSFKVIGPLFVALKRPVSFSQFVIRSLVVLELFL